MMTESLNPTQAEALAVLIRSVRPEWDVPGIKKALWDAKDRGTGWDVIHAALYAAEDLTNRTPAVIALAGAHWTRGRELGSSDPRGPKCEIHIGQPAHNCTGCAGDRKARADGAAAEPAEPPADTLTAYDTGPALVRAAMVQHGIPLSERQMGART